MSISRNLIDTLPFPLSTPSFALAPLQEADLSQVLEWRNKPEIRERMLQTAPIGMDNHRAWFQRLQQSDTQLHMLIRYRQQPVGVSNIKSCDDAPITQAEQLELGLYLGEDALRGSLLAFVPALLTIDLCFRRCRCASLLATVKPDNLAALRFNQTLGYRVLAGQGALLRMQLREVDFRRATAGLGRLLSL